MNMQNTCHPADYADCQYLDIAEKFLRPIKLRSHELMHICPGHTVLDLGCGVGVDTLRLADRVGPSGKVFGVDKDQDMVEEANSRARRAGLEGLAIHQLGEAARLPYPDGHFDACRSERVLMHVADASRVIMEMARILKPGGWLVAVEPDWATLSIATEQYDIERRLARIRAEQCLRNGYAGRSLCQLMRHANLQDVSVEITPLWSNDLSQVRYLTILEQVEVFALNNNLISQDELQCWRADLQRAYDGGYFFANLNMLIVVGRKLI